MEIKKTINKRTLNVEIIGELNSSSSPLLENSLKADINRIDNLVLDLAKCTYVSSAGLRVFLAARKYLNNQGDMSIINVTKDVYEVLEFTGFTKILEVKKQ